MIFTILTAVNYSGLIVPVTSLTSEGQIIAHVIPCMYYTRLVEGSFLKGLGAGQMWRDVAILLALRHGLLRLQLPTIPQEDGDMNSTFGLASWFSRLGVMTRKELVQFVRDLVLMLVLLYAFTMGVRSAGTSVSMQIEHAPIAFIDHDHSRVSRDLISRFRLPWFGPRGELPDTRARPSACWIPAASWPWSRSRRSSNRPSCEAIRPPFNSW